MDALAKEKYSTSTDKRRKPMSVGFMVTVSLLLAILWVLLMPSTAHARGASVSAARAMPSVSRAYSAPSRVAPVRRVVTPNPVLFSSKGNKDCNQERNKKLAECKGAKR